MDLLLLASSPICMFSHWLREQLPLFHVPFALFGFRSFCKKQGHDQLPPADLSAPCPSVTKTSYRGLFTLPGTRAVLCFPWQAGPQPKSFQKVSSHSNSQPRTVFCSCVNAFAALKLVSWRRHCILLYKRQNIFFLPGIHSRARKPSVCSENTLSLLR